MKIPPLFFQSQFSPDSFGGAHFFERETYPQDFEGKRLKRPEPSPVGTVLIPQILGKVPHRAEGPENNSGKPERSYALVPGALGLDVGDQYNPTQSVVTPGGAVVLHGSKRYAPADESAGDISVVERSCLHGKQRLA